MHTRLRRTVTRTAAVAIAVAFVRSLAWASPPRLNAARAAASPVASPETTLKPDPNTTVEIVGAPFIMAIFATHDFPIFPDSADGVRCTALAVQRTSTIVSLYTAAHCLLIDGFSLKQGSEVEPRGVHLSTDDTHQDSFAIQNIAVHPSLTRRFNGGFAVPATYSEADLSALFFPADCADWPVDAARIDLRAAEVGHVWELGGIPGTSAIRNAKADDDKPVRLFASGCQSNDIVLCNQAKGAPKRYMDKSFVTHGTKCARSLARSTSTAGVMPGDSGGPVFVAPKSDADDAPVSRWLGVISGVDDSGALLVAPFPTDLR